MCCILQALNFQHFPLPNQIAPISPWMSQTHCHSCALIASLFAPTPSEVHLPAGMESCDPLLWGGISGYRNHSKTGVWPYSEDFGPVWMSTKYGDPALAWKTAAKQHPSPKRSLVRSGDFHLPETSQLWSHSNQLLALMAHGLPTSSSNSSGTSPANCKVCVMS